MGMARNLASLLNSSGLITSAKIGNGEVSADDLASTLNLTGKTVTLPSGVGGKVLQVVSAYNDTEYTYNLTGATWTDTSISASITPTSSSSKVLVLCSVNFQGNYTSDQNAPVSARINRGGAVLTAKFGFHTVGNNAENQNTNDLLLFLILQILHLRELIRFSCMPHQVKPTMLTAHTETVVDAL